jgi:hypothetical protein
MTCMSQWKTLMIYRCRITCFTIRPLQIVIYIVSQLAVSDLTVAFMSIQCYNLHTRVSFLRLVPLKFFWYPGNYTQHQETRFHKIISSLPRNLFQIIAIMNVVKNLNLISK